MQMRPLERDTFSLWTHRSLESLSLYELLWVSALILACMGWFGIRYWGERTAALEEDLPLPEFPTSTIIFAAVLALVASVTVMKMRDGLTARATVTAAKASVRSLPSDDGVGLFDLPYNNKQF